MACQMYTSHMRKNGHPDLCVHKCGIIIHSKLGWLGASPDGRVTDPSSQCVNGIVEFKCPYAYRDKKLQEACKDEHFYCGLNDNGTIFLKVTHQYYHQVQLQLFYRFRYVCMVQLFYLWYQRSPCSAYFSRFEVVD